MSKRDPYPLAWPAGWKRTPDHQRERPRFDARFAHDRNRVLKQLGMRHASHIVITSDLPTRNDGLPYANANCRDPGIAVYWIEKGHEHVMACDRWISAAYNLRAIELSLGALRGLDRWGASETVEKAFAGFAALPPGNGAYSSPIHTPSRSWREVLYGDAELTAGLSNADQLALARARHRELIRQHHPDYGGSHERAVELNAALASAEKELGA